MSKKTMLQAILEETDRMDDAWPSACGEYAVYDSRAGMDGAIVMLAYLPCGKRPYSYAAALGAIPMQIDKLSNPDGHVTRSQWLEACYKKVERGNDDWAASQAEKYPAYWRKLPSHWRYIDTYRINELFPVEDDSGAILHARKKLILAGVRTGGKSLDKDLGEAVSTLECKLNN